MAKLRSRFERFGVHLVAAIGATGVFVAATAVGASQAGGSSSAVVPPPALNQDATTGSGAARQNQAGVRGTGTPADGPGPAADGSLPPNPPPKPAAPPRERALAGSVQTLKDDGLIVNVRGTLWHVRPAPGALIRRAGKNVPLSQLQEGDTLVLLGVAASGNRFSAHAITARPARPQS